jgi:periplasmic copper chaperone A
MVKSVRLFGFTRRSSRFHFVILLAVCPVLGRAQDAPSLPVSPETTAQQGEDAAESDSALKVEGAWARPARGAAKTGAVFLKITNSGKEADRLIEAVSNVAETVELHESYRDGNIMRMRRVDGMDIPANGVLELKPGGYHIMLIGVKDELSAGKTFSMDLAFKKAEKQTLEVKVKEQ